MFRDETIEAGQFSHKFQELKKKFDKKEEIHLDSEYLCELKSYIERIHKETCASATFDTKRFLEIREEEMSHLNRLQKMKNRTSYKKEKHKSKHQNEDWG